MGLLGIVMRVGGTLHTALFRRFRSPKIRRIAGLPILLLTVTGRRSGKAFTTPVVYLEHDGGYAVCASAGGQAEEPQWFKNLRAAPQARNEHGDVTREMFALYCCSHQRCVVQCGAQLRCDCDYELAIARAERL